MSDWSENTAVSTHDRGIAGGCHQHTVRTSLWCLYSYACRDVWNSLFVRKVWSVFSVLTPRAEHTSHTFKRPVGLQVHVFAREFTWLPKTDLQRRSDFLDYSVFTCKCDKEKLWEEIRCEGLCRIITSEGKGCGRGGMWNMTAIIRRTLSTIAWI